MKRKANNNIGQQLRVLRGTASQASVAAALGITASAVSQYERGERIPNDALKMAYAQLYGRTVDELFFKAQ